MKTYTSTVWEPAFGEWVRGIWASESNPIRDGMFVEVIVRRGVFNNGRFYRITDGDGKFWEYRAEDVVPVIK